MISTSPHPIEILLVEDNMGDVELTQDAFQEAKISNRILRRKSSRP